MEKEKLEVGSRFQFSRGYGVVVSNMAVVITGGGREGWKVEKTAIPEDARRLHDHLTVAMEIQMAMNGALAVLS